MTVLDAPKLSVPPPAGVNRTVFGLDPIQLHTRYWAALGVQVVRQGEPSQIVRHAELYLLTEARSLPLFKLTDVVETLNWMKPLVVMVRLHDNRFSGYRERVVTAEDDRFKRFERIYDSPGRLARVLLTPDREVAQLWQRVRDPQTGWRRLRKFIPRAERVTMSIEGHVYDRLSDREMAMFLHDLVRDWTRPDSTITGLKRHGQVWKDAKSRIDPEARLIGPVWVGAGRAVPQDQTIVGPAIVWDAPGPQPAGDEIQWLMIEPTEPPADANPKPITPLDRAFKRAFDIVFSVIAMVLTAPVYPIVMLWIWLENGRPFFYYQTRETIGGRQF
ncbi:MAG TPA: sugar transferase, partial [Tepidisphaeraceae bacterium]|nr:sugar transferase [Tepidisphaeraceae bacterium]